MPAVTNVTLSGATQHADVTEQWNFGCTLATDLSGGDHIEVTFPAGFDLSGVHQEGVIASPSVIGSALGVLIPESPRLPLPGYASILAGGWHADAEFGLVCFVYIVSVAGQTIQFDLYSYDFDPLNAQKTVTFAIAGVKNPPAGSFPAAGFAIATSSDLTPAHPAGPVIITDAPPPPAPGNSPGTSPQSTARTLEGIRSVLDAA